MHTWREGERLLRELPMIVVPRHGYTVPAVARHIQELPDLEIFEQGISSTQVRQRVSEGRSLEGLVSSGIERFIYHRRLYRMPVSSALAD
jgi:nicotinic acid mononucleotide adenylyltransferase